MDSYHLENTLRGDFGKTRIPLAPIRHPGDSVRDMSYPARQARIDAIPPKEVPSIMRITLTIDVPSLIAYANVANAIAEQGGTLLSANQAPTPEVSALRLAPDRSAVGPSAITDLFNSALAQSDVPEVYINYRSDGDFAATERLIKPLRWESNGNLAAIDVRTGGYKQYVVNSAKMTRAEIR